MRDEIGIHAGAGPIAIGLDLSSLRFRYTAMPVRDALD
jgi:hypothetical protein